MSNRTRSERKKRSQTASLRHFKRLLGYVWPQRRYLIPLIISVVGLAVTYSLSIASILPTLAVIVGEEGLHGRIDREIAQQRFKISLAGYSRYRDSEVDGVNEGDALVTNVEPGSPLAKAGMHRGDFILAVNGQRGSLVTIVDHLADAATGAPLDLEILTQNETRTTTAVAGERSGLLHFGRRVVGLMPGGLSPGERMHTLAYVMVLLLALLVVSNISLLAARYLTVLVCARAIMDLRRQLYTHVLNLPMSRFSQNTSDMMSRFVQDMQEVFRGLSNFFEQVVAEPLKALGVITVALFIQPRVTLIVLVATPIAALIFREFGKKIRRANRKLLAGYGQMLGAIESSLNGMRVVKGYTREDYERKRLFRIDRRMLKQQLRLGFVEALASPVIELLGFAAAAALVMWFASQVAYGELEIQSFVAMLICFGAVFQPVRKLSKVYPKVQRASAAGERLFEIIDSPSEYQRDHLMVSLQPIRESIEFRGITFGYPDAKRPAVNLVNLHVQQGESIAIVGPNGCGKTTLVSLLPRFFEPSHGQILIDGQDIANVKLRSLRKQISLITQETVIFSDTVTNNILYGRPNASLEEVYSAAERAFADEFVRDLPNGYDTVVGEHGATLSGGQRQRIAIARAILRDAPILIFDEATSQIDPESELKIHQALDAFITDRTAFMIAHRYSTISEADRIVVMDEGNVIAVGTHEKLLGSCPLYRRLYETQFRDAG